MSNAEQAIERVTQWAWEQTKFTTEPDLLDDLILVLAIAREAISKPRYTHDCDKCVYLGRYSDEQYDESDLYFCPATDPQLGFPETVVVRYADDGPSYSSGMVLADRGLNKALVEAKRRAIDKGLMVDSGKGSE